MPDGDPLTISINTLGLRDNYLAEIQNLADIAAFIYGGHELTTADKYSLPLGFVTIEPAASRKLTFEQAKERSDEWLLGSLLTDSVNITGNLLDDSRAVCALLRLFSPTKQTKGAEVNRVLIEEAKRFHRLGFPKKFEILREEYGVRTQLEEHFLSLNRARNCFVHRRGIVSREDTTHQDELVVKWRTGEMVAKAVDGDSEVVLTKPEVLQSESHIFIRIVDKTKAFSVGQKISFDRDELCQNIFTLFFLARELVASVDEYGRKIGAM
jgi:hypothetical protein